MMGESVRPCKAPRVVARLSTPGPGSILRPVKIYTRTGDDGSTGLLGPGRVSKSSTRVEAYGSVDELNAVLGAVSNLDGERWLQPHLGAIQSQLFNVGAELATVAPELRDRLERVGEGEIAELERWIDRLDQELPRLTNFILPGGTALASALHLARTVCRRAERRLVALGEGEAVASDLIRYLNRLGDLLFVLARWCNQRAGVRETEWTGGGGAGS